jgi:hypothetical protein
MITWFAPLGRQLKEVLFQDPITAKYLSKKAINPPFLVTAALQKILQQPNLNAWSLQCNAAHSMTHTYVMLMSNTQENHAIMV